MRDGGDVVVVVVGQEDDCSADVVGVGVAVDEMRDGEVGDVADCVEEFVTMHLAQGQESCILNKSRSNACTYRAIRG